MMMQCKYMVTWRSTLKEIKVYRIEQNFLHFHEFAGNFALSCTLSFTFCHFFTSIIIYVGVSALFSSLFILGEDRGRPGDFYAISAHFMGQLNIHSIFTTCIHAHMHSHVITCDAGCLFGSEMATPKCVEVATLLQCMDKLATGISIDPLLLSNKLLAEELISPRLVRQMLDSSKGKYDKATELVMEVINIVENSPEKFEVFMNALSEELLCLGDLVNQVRRKYEDNQAKAKVKIQLGIIHACI